MAENVRASDNIRCTVKTQGDKYNDRGGKRFCFNSPGPAETQRQVVKSPQQLGEIRSMKTLTLFVAIVTGALAFTAPADAQQKKLVLSTEAAYAPFNYRATDGTLGGFDIDIGNALC